MVGLSKFDDKRKREIRRKNHKDRDLRTQKVKQKIRQESSEKKFNWRTFTEE